MRVSRSTFSADSVWSKLEFARRSGARGRSERIRFMAGRPCEYRSWQKEHCRALSRGLSLVSWSCPPALVRYAPLFTSARRDVARPHELRTALSPLCWPTARAIPPICAIFKLGKTAGFPRSRSAQKERARGLAAGSSEGRDVGDQARRRRRPPTTPAKPSRAMAPGAGTCVNVMLQLATEPPSPPTKSWI